MTASMSTMVLVDPTVNSVAASASMAPRPESLEGLVVGLLNNGKAKADLVLDAVQRRLEKQYKLAGVVRHQKGVASKPMPPEILQDIVGRCRVAITAVGD